MDTQWSTKVLPDREERDRSAGYTKVDRRVRAGNAWCRTLIAALASTSMGQTHFFLTAIDLIRVVTAVEARASIDYIETRVLARTAIAQRYCSGLDIPNLGVATANSSIRCESYLVVPAGTEVAVRVVGEHGFVDQLANPESVTFTPAGVLASGVLLHGRVSTAYDGAVSGTLLRAFQRAIREHCSKVNAFYVGPEAESLWRNGARLAGDVAAPSEYDLRGPVS